jgi:hypothetical protein
VPPVEFVHSFTPAR